LCICTSSTDKDIDVSFIGAVKNERGYILDILKNNNINVYLAGGRGPNGQNLTFEEYANIIRRSKVSLNFNWAYSSPQRKGRIFEIAACKSFMLTNFPEALKGKEGWCFEDKKHFDSFNDKNVVEKVKYWLKNEAEREQIATSMYELYVQKYAPVPWWTNIFDICKI
jgi:spore maturation protein CgeB